MSGGGITPARSLRMTFSHTSACSAALVRSSPCSDRLAVLRRSLWQVTQYRSRRARGFSLETGNGAEPGARAAAAPTHRTTNVPIAHERRMKDRAGPGRIMVMPAKNMVPNGFGNQIKKDG